MGEGRRNAQGSVVSCVCERRDGGNISKCEERKKEMEEGWVGGREGEKVVDPLT